MHSSAADAESAFFFYYLPLISRKRSRSHRSRDQWIFLIFKSLYLENESRYRHETKSIFQDILFFRRFGWFKLKKTIDKYSSFDVGFFLPVLYKWILTNGLRACIRMKLDNSRESWGGKHRQDRSPGSYPAHLHLHPAKKRGESDRRSTVTRSLWAIVRARRCYHSPWALRLDGGGGTPQRGQSLRSRWIFNGIAEGIKKGGGKGAEEAEWRKKQKEKDTIIRITDRSVPISIFRSFLEKEIRLLSPVRNDCPPKPSLIHAISNCYYFIIGSI